MTFTVLFLTGNKNGAISGFLSVYGRVPFAYFIVHLYLIHALMFAVLYLQGFGSSDFVFGLFRNGRPENGGGTGLAVVYIIWICVVLLLNPLCRWYGNYKATHRDKKWLGYL